MDPILARDGYVRAERFIDPGWAGVLYTLLLIRQWRGQAKRDDQVPDAQSHWGDATLDALLMGLLPAVEIAAGCPLLPTYAYARLYLRGQCLPRHCDREACEIAVSIHLGSSGIVPPLRFAPDVEVHQRPGDAVVYLGDRMAHWRDSFEGHDFGQLFLNYVRADGSRRALIYDGRRNAFPPSVALRETAAMPGLA